MRRHLDVALAVALWAILMILDGLTGSVIFLYLAVAVIVAQMVAGTALRRQ